MGASWSSLLEERARTGSSIESLLSREAAEDVSERFRELAALFGVEVLVSLPPSDYERVEELAEKLMCAAAAARMFGDA